ncbi:MAG: hypothetical protein L3J46_08695 [Kangiellaceae bacterium]|nr:hypothetical protein [Kangiellaceae bacterium]
MDCSQFYSPYLVLAPHREDKNSLRSGNYPLLSMPHGFHRVAIKPLGRELAG